MTIHTTIYPYGFLCMVQESKLPISSSEAHKQMKYVSLSIFCWRKQSITWDFVPQFFLSRILQFDSAYGCSIKSATQAKGSLKSLIIPVDSWCKLNSNFICPLSSGGNVWVRCPCRRSLTVDLWVTSLCNFMWLFVFRVGSMFIMKKSPLGLTSEKFSNLMFSQTISITKSCAHDLAY